MEKGSDIGSVLRPTNPVDVTCITGGIVDGDGIDKQALSQLINMSNADILTKSDSVRDIIARLIRLLRTRLPGSIFEDDAVNYSCSSAGHIFAELARELKGTLEGNSRTVGDIVQLTVAICLAPLPFTSEAGVSVFGIQRHALHLVRRLIKVLEIVKRTPATMVSSTPARVYAALFYRTVAEYNWLYSIGDSYLSSADDSNLRKLVPAMHFYNSKVVVTQLFSSISSLYLGESGALVAPQCEPTGSVFLRMPESRVFSHRRDVNRNASLSGTLPFSEGSFAVQTSALKDLFTRKHYLRSFDSHQRSYASDTLRIPDSFLVSSQLGHCYLDKLRVVDGIDAQVTGDSSDSDEAPSNLFDTDEASSNDSILVQDSKIKSVRFDQ